MDHVQRSSHFLRKSCFALLCSSALTIANVHTAFAQADPTQDTETNTSDTDESAQPLEIVQPVPEGTLVNITFDPSVDGSLKDEWARTGFDVWARTGLRRNQHLTLEDARAALLRLMDSQTFADARVSVRQVRGGVELHIEGERLYRMREVTFVGVQSRSVDNVRADFGVLNNSLVTYDDVHEAMQRLVEAYRASGYPLVTVETQSRAVVDPVTGVRDPSTRVLIVVVTESPPVRVREVRFTGVPAELLEPLREGLKISGGDVADPTKAQSSVDSLRIVLRHEGYLASTVAAPTFVNVNSTQVDVVYDISLGRSYRIEFKGAVYFSDRVLEPALKLEEERSMDAATLTVLAARVRDFYVRRAFLDVQVRAQVRDERDEAVLSFTIRPGPQLFVRKLEFPGAVNIPTNQLRDILMDVLYAEIPGGELIAEPGQGVEDLLDGGPGWSGRYVPPPRAKLRPDHTFVPDLYAEAARRMVTRYRDNGFLDADVALIEPTRVEDVLGEPALDVQFAITEGPRTLLDEVIFEGNEHISSEELASIAKIDLAVPLSFSALEEARTRVADYYREKSYLFVRVTPEVDRSPNREHARVRWVIHEGPSVVVGRILIRGNARTNRDIILDRITLREGRPYLPEAVRYSQQKLGELGIFVGVSITPTYPDVEAPVKDVVIQVIEVKPQYIEMRGGFSSGEGVRVGFEYGWRNIGGTAISLTARGQVGYLISEFLADVELQREINALPIGDRLRRNLSASLLFPVIPGLGPNVRANLDLSHSRVIERQFAIETTAAALSVTFRPQRLFSLSLAQEFQGNGLTLFRSLSIDSIISMADPAARERLRRLLLLPRGTTFLAASRITAVLDLRDQVFNPQKGIYVTGTFEWVHRLGFIEQPGSNTPPEQEPTGNTLRFIGAITGYIPIPLGNMVFASNLRGGVNINPSPVGVTYTNRQFFLGGADSMRAWLQDTFIPQDVYERECPDPSQNCALLDSVQRGGNAFVNWRNELRIPFGSTGFGGALFLDIGNLWKDVSAVDFLKLRASAGFGVRYFTPIGPLAIDVGFNLAPLNLGRRPLTGGGLTDTSVYEALVAPSFSIGVF